MLFKEAFRLEDDLSGHEVIGHHDSGGCYLSKHIVESDPFHSGPHQSFRQQKARDAQLKGIPLENR